MQHFRTSILCKNIYTYLHAKTRLTIWRRGFVSDSLLHRVFTFIVDIKFWFICFSETFPFLPYSHTLLVFFSLSLFYRLPLSLTHSQPHLSLSLILSSSLSLSIPLLSLFLSLRFFPPFSFFPSKTIQPLLCSFTFTPFTP